MFHSIRNIFDIQMNRENYPVDDHLYAYQCSIIPKLFYVFVQGR